MGKPLTARELFLGPVMVVVPILVVIVWAMTAKGVWYDELWSKWMASRELGMADAADLRWFRDVHPPLFYALNWLVSGIVGTPVHVHRVLNLLPLAGLVGVGAFVFHVRPAMQPALVVAGVLFLANHETTYFGEYRSYALIMCATAALALLMVEMLNRGRDLVWAKDRLLCLMLGSTILLALNLHYISTLVCGVTIMIFAVDQLRLRRWRWAAMITFISAVSMLAVFAALWAQRPYMAETVPNFWVSTNFRSALQSIVGRAFQATGKNIAIFIAMLLWARALAARAHAGQKRVAEDSAEHAVVLFVLSLLLSGVMLLAINAYRPVVTPRYLLAMTPISILSFALLLGNIVAGYRQLFVLFLVNALGVGLFYGWSIQKKLAWDEGALLVAQMVEACPDALVYSLPRSRALPASRASGIPNESEFMHWAIADLGKTYGFRSHPLPRPETATVPLSPTGCPTIVYIEDAASIDGDLTAQRVGLKVASGQKLETLHTRTGTIIRIGAPSVE